MPGKPALSKQERQRESSKKFRLANREKVAEYNKQYKLANREKIAAQRKEYYLANRDKILAQNKQYRLANPEKFAEIRRQWDSLNKDKKRETRQRRRARKHSLESTLTFAEWQKIVDDHFGRCCYCGAKSDSLTQDHVVPVSNGGGYTAENIVPACSRCNSSKGAKDYKKFVKESKDRLQMELF